MASPRNTLSWKSAHKVRDLAAKADAEVYAESRLVEEVASGDADWMRLLIWRGFSGIACWRLSAREKGF